MNLFNPNFDKDINEIIDAFSIVYGESFKSIIASRIKNRMPVNYINYKGINRYISDLKNHKSKELSKKFIEKIGIKTKNEKEKLDEAFNYFNIYNAFDNKTKVYFIKLLSFIPLTEELKNNEEIKEGIIKEQIDFINFLLKEKLITKENYEDFKLTDKYKEILKTITKYIEIFNELQSEYEDFVKENNIKEYEVYVEKESKRKKEINDEKVKLAVKKLKNYVPEYIAKIIDEKSEKITVDLEDETCFESFSKEDEETLNNPETPLYEKKAIAYSRLITLVNLGLTFDEKITYNNSLTIYEKIKERNDVKVLIPSFELVEIVTKIREEYKEELEREFIYTSEWFKELTKTFKDSKTQEYLYKTFKNKKICIDVGKKDNKEFIILLFFAINNIFGFVDFLYLHELTHIIETNIISQNVRFFGFDIMDLENGISLNPYNKEKRKYERMNETITDIIASEVSEILHKKGIYFAEPKEIINNKTQDSNTNRILKNMLLPLFISERETILESRITGNLDKFINKIGRDNFENLNDTINKVDYLLEKGLYNKLKNNELDDPLVIDYKNELKRIEKIYLEIEYNISLTKESTESKKSK